MGLILLVVAILLELIAAILGFGVFNTNADLGSILGLIALGIGCFAGASLVAAAPLVRQ